ncbi:hypothetical protein SAMN05421741_104183 [Paenimyroides ummariense]|uniref:Uncharacterized protein n=1 Tax=Paenimyroides ummariense TaxID=913024 RepID=A0A1I4YI97_9FLAO|nr:hypothetical protein [Paenimyroides ummariense]SFN37725.1 hypothetical protein SAMN05421741_104183 [Paenimyroides ummariense]
MKKNTLLAIAAISILSPLLIVAAIHYLNGRQGNHTSSIMQR